MQNEAFPREMPATAQDHSGRSHGLPAHGWNGDVRQQRPGWKQTCPYLCVAGPACASSTGNPSTFLPGCPVHCQGEARTQRGHLSERGEPAHAGAAIHRWASPTQQSTPARVRGGCAARATGAFLFIRSHSLRRVAFVS